MLMNDRAPEKADAPVKSRHIVMLRASWETQDKLREWAKASGFDLAWSHSGWPQHSSDFDFHITIAVSENEVRIEDGCRWIDGITVTPSGYGVMGDSTPALMIEASKPLTALRSFFVDTLGMVPTYKDFKPHISLSYKWSGDPEIMKSAPMMPDFPLVFDVLMVAIFEDTPAMAKDAAPLARNAMHANDAVQISGTRKTADGYLVTDARVARGGNIQEYYGYEVGDTLQPGRVVKVYRPVDEIFKRSSLATFAHKPVTMGHPQEGVSPETFRKDAVGHIGSDVVRDGEFVRVPLVVMDAQAISDIESGVREISMGYDCELIMEGGTTPDGRVYDAYQKNIRINHCAVVEAGRAGPQCRIGDQSRIAQQKKDVTPMTKSVTIDGKTYEVADDVAAALVSGKVSDTLTASAKALSDATAALTSASARADVAEKQVKDLAAEIADLKAKAPTADDIAKAAAELVDTINVAKAVAPKVETSGKTADAIKRDVVIAAIGDGAKGKDAAYIAAAFDMLSKGKVGVGDKVANAIANASSSAVNDAAKQANDSYDNWLTNSWKTGAK